MSEMKPKQIMAALEAVQKMVEEHKFVMCFDANCEPALLGSAHIRNVKISGHESAPQRWERAVKYLGRNVKEKPTLVVEFITPEQEQYYYFPAKKL